MAVYKYIIDCELFILRYFKLDPFNMFKHMALYDLRIYITQILEMNKKDAESINKKDIEKAMVYLRDVLIFITMGKQGIRLKL